MADGASGRLPVTRDDVRDPACEILEAGDGAFTRDRLRETAEAVDRGIGVDADLRGRVAPARVHECVFDDDQPAARGRPSAVVVDDAAGDEAIGRGQARPHRRHDDSVPQREPVERQRRQ